MSKRLISEITRLHQLMGVKNSSLIIESAGCPFCSSIMKQVDNFITLLNKGSMNPPEFKLKINDLLDRLSKNEDLSLTEKTALKNILSKIKEAESASSNVSKFREDLAYELMKRKEAFSDINYRSKSVDDIVKSSVNLNAISSDIGFAKHLFDTYGDIVTLKKQVQELVNFPVKMEKIVNNYKTIDSYVDAIGGVFESTLKEAGYDEPLLSNLVLLMKKFVKEETGLKFAFPSKMDEPINTKPIDIQNKVEEPNNDINIKVKSVGKELPPSRFHIGGTSIDSINMPGARPIGGSDPIIAKDRRGWIINNPYYSFVVEEIGDDVVYTFNRQDIQDAAGRSGNYSVSINYPKNGGVSLDDVKQILLNKSNEIFNKLKDAKARGYGGADIGEVSTPTNAIPDGESGVFTPTPEIPILKR